MNKTKRLIEIENQVCEQASKIQRLYFDNERFFDTKWYAERLGFDNLSWVGEQGVLSLAYQNEDGVFQEGEFDNALKETYVYFTIVKRLMDNEGYGQGASARGFDVTRPLGRIWNICCTILRLLAETAQITGRDTRVYQNKAITEYNRITGRK